MPGAPAARSATYQDLLQVPEHLALRTLEVFRLDGEGWRLATSDAGDTVVRAEPFDVVELDMAALWAR
jgi:hypothetical protein